MKSWDDVKLGDTLAGVVIGSALVDFDLGTAGRATESKPLPDYAVRKCRGHWHVTSCGEDIITDKGDALSYDDAVSEMERLNNGG